MTKIQNEARTVMVNDETYPLCLSPLNFGFLHCFEFRISPAFPEAARRRQVLRI
jgi:hypothetical protein